MKKFLAYLTVIAAISGLMPATAFAELQCYSSPTYATHVSVQTAAQCASFDPTDPKPRLLDTSTNKWTDPATGAAVYTPGYTCVGLAPAYRTTDPGADGSCTAGYKLGQVTVDQNGNITKINYTDGTVETVNRDTTGSVLNTNYSATPPAAAAPAPAPAGSGRLTYTPLEPLPGATANTYNSLGTYLNLVFNILLSIGGMIAVVTLVLGGITYMVSEIVDRKAEAKRRMQAAIWGLLLLLSCWLILHEINPNLTQFSLGALDNQSVQPAASNPAPAAAGVPATAAGTPTNTAQLNAQLQNCNGAVTPSPSDNTPTCI